MGQLADLCLDCDTPQPKQQQEELYNYQVYQKVPPLGSLNNYQRLFKNGSPQRNTLMSRYLTQTPASDPLAPLGSKAPQRNEDLAGILSSRNLLPVAEGGPQENVFSLAGGMTFVRKVKKSKYKKLVARLKAKGEKFTDPDFPPNQQSLGDLKGRTIEPSLIQWRRVQELLPGAVFVKDVIQPTDVLQGALGNCYLLSSLAALAEQDYRVKNLFPSLQMSQEGVYMARILHNGEYQEVIVDDYFPVSEKGKPRFAKPSGGIEIWAMVLEKCWAKLHGSYTAIIAGKANEGLHAFSTAPVYNYPLPSELVRQDELWEKMIRSEKQGQLMAASSKSDQSIREKGMVTKHAYTILGVYDRPMRLLKLRNPHGRKEWRGRASDFDLQFWNQMSPQNKQHLNYEDEARKKDKDGVFFMPWTDFFLYFKSVDICRINDNAHYNYITAEFPHLTPRLFAFEIRTPTSSPLTFGVTQPSKRGTSRKSHSRNYAVLGRWDPARKSYLYVESKGMKTYADNFLEIEGSQPGKYLLYTKFLWTQDRSEAKAVISAYCDCPVSIEPASHITPDEFLRQVFLDHATKNEKKVLLPRSQDWTCSELLLKKGGFSYFVACLAPHSTNHLSLTLQEKDYTEQGLVLQGPEAGKGVVRRELRPGQTWVVVSELLSEDFPSSVSVPDPAISAL